MIDKIYRLIYISSLAIIALALISIVVGGLFFDFYKNSPSIERIVGWFVLIGPFAPIGTLFGTLKEDQSTRKKMTILICTGLSVLFLLVFIWGTVYAAAFV